MRIDISLLPALAAAFMLVFARIGAMVMLLPGFGEANIPVRVKPRHCACTDAHHPAAASQRLYRRA
jgi:flagellar biosynthesis protein FliR